MSLSGAAAFFGCDDGTEESKDTKENTQVLCTDGEDNDNNGKKDCEDSACKPFCNTEWEFSEWPEGKSPEEIGKLLAENFVQRSLGSGEMEGRNGMSGTARFSILRHFAGVKVKSLIVTPRLPSLRETCRIFCPLFKASSTAGVCCHRPMV